MFNWGKKQESTDLSILREILSTEQGRKDFLGYANPIHPTPEKQKEDLARAVKYCDSQDYQIWAKQAWSHVLTHLDRLLASKSATDTDFERGALKATLNLLAVSYTARIANDAMHRNSQVSPNSRRA